MNALAPNIQTVIVSRALQGVFASAGVSMLAGTIADIWQPHERGVPMAMFSFTAVFSIGLGSVFGGLIASNPHLGWRWVQWIHVMFAGIFSLCVIFALSETRSSVVLARIAKDVRKTTGDARYQSSSETDKPSMLSMIKVTCTRPLYLLLTEPIVQSFSLWVGLTWGVLFCLLDVGAILGLMANMYQETLYRKHFGTKGQEARLYIACAAAIVMPVSMFIFAWTASPHIHWIFPLIGLTAFMSGVFVVYQVSFLYLADCYGTYASSALAGLSLARNISALIFPLFSQQMFAGMTYKWGLTLWASLSAVMGPIPWILFFIGPKVRSHSKVSRKILEAELQQLDGDKTVVSSPIEEKSMKV
ncbi:hypothetical protein AZE42_10118 [Rhizopogon vesiculosus]|uniref:Major facilitator superfamily (MFS) profile domain-containing protein n=1 Tax=Rhizopogon vesiculosus TaxID=180088 RepID=A0A1J8Q9E0_9AGAM|nr:hypothetical protein AZE42_10118 [Rhizopogon vesiculosus]